MSQSISQEAQAPSAAAAAAAPASQHAGGAPAGKGSKNAAAADGRGHPMTSAKQSGRKNVQMPSACSASCLLYPLSGMLLFMQLSIGADLDPIYCGRAAFVQMPIAKLF